MQAFLGGLYLNQFNRFGRQWRVFLQAEGEERLSDQDIGHFYVRNNDGNMVPLSALATTRRISGPEYTNRFNLYRAAQVLGSAAPGYSSGQAMTALEEVARQVLPREIGYDWADLSYQEKKASAEGEGSQGEGKSGEHKAGDEKSAEGKPESAAKLQGETSKPAENSHKQ